MLYFKVVTRRYAVRNDQWERNKELLFGRQGCESATARRDNWLFVEAVAVVYRHHAGIAYRDLPERFGDFRAVHPRRPHWGRQGI